MPLHTYYRPVDLDEFIGNEAIKTSIKSLFLTEDKPHTYLFHGPAGCGKTTLARILGAMLNCSEEDVHEYDAANTRGIDTIRKISENMHYSGMMSRNKMYILDEAHQITKDAKEATLKMLEEPPPHVYFALCTTEPEKLPITIFSRSTKYKVSHLNDKQMNELIKWILASEKVEDFSESIIKEIIIAAEGCPREALVSLGQVINMKDEKEALAIITISSASGTEVIEICRAIIALESWATLKDKVKTVLLNVEPEKLRYAVLGYFGAVLLNSKTNDRASEIIDLFSENTYASGKAGVSNMIYLAVRK